MLGYIIKATTSRFSSMDRFNEVEKFFKENPAPNSKRAIEQSLEAIRINSNFVKNNENGLKNWDFK